MSVKRYDIEETLMEERPEGEYVKHSDYTATYRALVTLAARHLELEAECARMKQVVAKLAFDSRKTMEPT